MTASEQLWQAYHKELGLFVRKKVRDASTADDILQDVFIKMHLNLDTLTDKDRARSWLYSITRNLVTDHFRKTRNYSSIEEVKLPAEEKPSEKPLNLCLRPMIDKLPAKYREAIILADIEKEGQMQMAKLLNVSYTGVKSRVQRARKLLKKYLSDCCEIVADKYGNIVSHEPRNKTCSCN
jgi:RNA polymerase sigma-70 factor, ECF subfamily